MKYIGQVPVVRFGSTETCLQVCGTPMTRSWEERLDAFRKGWAMAEGGGGGGGSGGDDGDDEKGAVRGGGEGGRGGEPGYYIGRPHPPFTELMVVEGIDPSLPSSYLVECPEGKQGLLVTRGRNVMRGYVQGVEATRKAVHAEAGGWYVNLGDVGFWLWGEQGGGREGGAGDEGGVKDFYWVSRTSNLLIRGGTNYSYEQISRELTRFVNERYKGLGNGRGEGGGGGGGGGFILAAVGLRVRSEHEDDCLVTIELLGEGGKEEVERTFVREAGGRVSKGAKPTRVRFGKVERNFKGDVNWRALEAAWKEVLKKEEEEEETKGKA